MESLMIPACLLVYERSDENTSGGKAYMPKYERHSNLKMYAEVRSSIMDSVDSLKDLAEQLGKKFVVSQDDQD